MNLLSSQPSASYVSFPGKYCDDKSATRKKMHDCADPEGTSACLLSSANAPGTELNHLDRRLLNRG